MSCFQESIYGVIILRKFLKFILGLSKVWIGKWELRNVGEPEELSEGKIKSHFSLIGEREEKFYLYIRKHFL